MRLAGFVIALQSPGHDGTVSTHDAGPTPSLRGHSPEYNAFSRENQLAMERVKRAAVRTARVLLLLVVFLGVARYTFVPCCDLVERLNVRQVGEVPGASFGVLVLSPDGKFETRNILNLEDRTLVTDIADADVERVNRDLRASIGDTQGSYQYFKVLKRDPGYVDVLLEIPTERDWQFKYWYRIENGTVHEQQWLVFGPIAATLGGLLSLFVASIAVACCLLLERYTRKNYTRSAAAANGGRSA